MKTLDPSKTIADALEKIQFLEGEIPKLKKQADDCTSELATLEISADLTDSKAMAEVGRLQTIVFLYPRRISARQADLVQGIEDLKKACLDVVGFNLACRYTNLLKSYKAKISKELSHHFKNPDQLDVAVENSDLVMQLRWNEANLVSLTSDIPIYSLELLKKHAARIIQMWHDANAFEKENLS